MFLLALSAFAAEPTVTPAPVPEIYRFVPSQRRLHLDLRAGHLTVRTDASVDAIEVRVTGPATCVTEWETGGVIDIEGCEAEVQVVAPFGTFYGLSVGTGDVTLATTGKLRLSVGTGNVSGTARGAVRVKVGTGDVRLEGLTQEPVVAVARGEAELSYAEGASGG